MHCSPFVCAGITVASEKFGIHAENATRGSHTNANKESSKSTSHFPRPMSPAHATSRYRNAGCSQPLQAKEANENSKEC